MSCAHPCRTRQLRDHQVPSNSWSLYKCSLHWVCLLAFLMFPASSLQASMLGKRNLSQLSLEQISILVSTSDPLQNMDPSNPNSHLSRILIPRAGERVIYGLQWLTSPITCSADTENSTIVREYIIATLKALNWHIDEDTFTDSTPIGMRRFTNVIATKDATASRRVILSAHLDSKYFSTYPQNQVRIF